MQIARDIAIDDDVAPEEGAAAAAVEPTLVAPRTAYVHDGNKRKRTVSGMGRGARSASKADADSHSSAVYAAIQEGDESTCQTCLKAGRQALAFNAPNHTSATCPYEMASQIETVDLAVSIEDGFDSGAPAAAAAGAVFDRSKRSGAPLMSTIAAGKRRRIPDQ